MITQILAVVVVFVMAHFLLRLRHFILACGKDKRKYYRAYIVGFDETDWDSDLDDNSSNKSDSQGATIMPAALSNSLAEWPTELAFQIESAAHVPKASTEKHVEATDALKPYSAGKAKAQDIPVEVSLD